MGFMESAVKATKNLTRFAARKSKHAAEYAKVKLSITMEKEELKEAYAALGEYFYENERDDCYRMAPLLSQGIEVALYNIETYNEKLASLAEKYEYVSEEREYDPPATWEVKSHSGAWDVPRGADYGEDTPNVGFAIPAEEDNNDDDDGAEKVTCEGCGARMSVDDTFCVQCGHRR